MDSAVQLDGPLAFSVAAGEPLKTQAIAEQCSPAGPTFSAGPAAPRRAHCLAVGAWWNVAPEAQSHSLRLHACLPTALLHQKHAIGVKGGLHTGRWGKSQAATGQAPQPYVALPAAANSYECVRPLKFADPQLQSANDVNAVAAQLSRRPRQAVSRAGIRGCFLPLLLHPHACAATAPVCSRVLQGGEARDSAASPHLPCACRYDCLQIRWG